MSEDDECIHLLRPNECSLCRPPRPPVPSRARHRWDDLENAVCVGAWFRHRGAVPGGVVAELAHLIDTTEASVVLKMADIAGELGEGPKWHPSEASKVLAQRFEALSHQERREAYDELLADLRARAGEPPPT